MGSPTGRIVRTVGIERLRRPKGRHERSVPRVSDADVALVRRYGVLTPVPVCGNGNGPWEIVAREADWIAAQRAGLHEIPIIVLSDLDPADLDRIASMAGEFDPVAGARDLQRRLAALGSSLGRGALTALAAEIGRTPSWICHRLRLLDLPVPIRDAVAIGVLSPGHGRALVRAGDDDQRLRLATRTIRDGWSVRRLEQAIREGVDGAAGRDPAAVQPSRPPARPPDLERLERRVGGVLGCPVTIDEAAGTLVIDYRGSLDVLDGVLERLGAGRPEDGWG